MYFICLLCVITRKTFYGTTQYDVIVAFKFQNSRYYMRCWCFFWQYVPHSTFLIKVWILIYETLNSKFFNNSLFLHFPFFHFLCMDIEQKRINYKFADNVSWMADTNVKQSHNTFLNREWRIYYRRIKENLLYSDECSERINCNKSYGNSNIQFRKRIHSTRSLFSIQH